MERNGQASLLGGVKMKRQGQMVCISYTGQQQRVVSTAGRSSTSNALLPS